MDLVEYALSEPQRTLRRLGITHFWPEAAALAVMKKEQVAPGPKSFGLTADLPEYLQALFHGKQPPVPTMWTYLGLEEDLKAETVSSRLDLFQKIHEAACTLGGWKAGDLSVWPLTIPLVSVVGFDFFQPRLLLFFGSLPELHSWDAPLQSRLTRIQVQSLPSLESMLAGNQAAKNTAWAALKSLAARLRTT